VAMQGAPYQSEKVSPEDYAFLQGLVREALANVLGQDKESLVESRLMPIVWRRRLANLAELFALMRAGTDKGLNGEVLDVMTTNETWFFRDQDAFNLLREDLIPQLVAKNQGSRSLRIWSAACSSGQEAYSVALLLKQHFPALEGWDIQITATDVSERMVERVKTGSYSQMEINRGMPLALLVKYFTQTGPDWFVAGALKAMVKAQALNLARPFAGLPPFDLVILRNVLFYFEDPVKREVLKRVTDRLAPGGLMLLGHAENGLAYSDALERTSASKTFYYKLKSFQGACHDTVQPRP